MSGLVEVERPRIRTHGVDAFVDKITVKVAARMRESFTWDRAGVLPQYDLSRQPPSAHSNDGAGQNPAQRVLQETRSTGGEEVSLASRTSQSTHREEAEAGPSTPYRRSLRLKGSTTSFLDVTESISDTSEHPVSGGGFCDVYTAYMTGEGKVALKRLRLFGNSEKALKRFRHEAEIWINLNHPNVLQFFGVCKTGPTLYMVSLWQENGHMLAYFETHPEADRLKFVAQVADALSYLHSHDPKVIHGDIKGQNVLVSKTGDPLLCDFGLSMVLSEMAVISGVPTGVQDGGSIRWLAPELMQGSETKTTASDVYSFALLVVEAYTGFIPFSELKIDAAVINAVINGKRPENPFRPENAEEERLWRLLQICWHQLIKARPSMDAICMIMQSLQAKEVDDEVLFSRALKLYLIGDCTLDDYIQAVNDNEKLRHPQRKVLDKVQGGHATTPSRVRVLARLTVHMWSFICMHVCLFMLSVCALALNIILLPNFRQGHSRFFRSVMPYFGITTWAWVSGVAEPLLLVTFGQLLLGRNGPLRLPQYLFDKMRLLSLLLCSTSSVFVLVASFSRSFASDRPPSSRFRRLLMTFDVLSVLLASFTHIDFYAYFFSRFWYRRRAHRAAMSRESFTTALGRTSAIYLDTDDQRPQRVRNPTKSRTETNKGEGKPVVERDKPDQASRNSSEPHEDESPEPRSIEGETANHMSAKQKGKQRAIQSDPDSSQTGREQP